MRQEEEQQHLLRQQSNEQQIPVPNEEIFLKIIIPSNQGAIEQIQNSLDLQNSKTCEYVLKILTDQYDENENCFKIEYLKGTPLSKLNFSNDQKKIEIIKQLYDLDTFLKQNGIIHNNIKPNNIIMLDGKLKLTDFNNEYYMMRNFQSCQKQEYCLSTLLYLPDKILLEISKYVEFGKFQSFGEDKQSNYLVGLQQNKDEQNRLYDNSDSQSIAFIMLELLKVVPFHHEIGQNYSIKQIIEKRKEQGQKLLKYLQLDQQYIQFIEVQALGEQVDLSNFENLNQLIEEYIEQHSNELIQQRFLNLFNEEQLKNYINKTNKQQNKDSASKQVEFAKKIQNLIFLPISFVQYTDNMDNYVFILNHLKHQINNKQNTEKIVKQCKFLACVILQQKNPNKIWEHLKSLVDRFKNQMQQQNRQNQEIIISSFQENNSQNIPIPEGRGRQQLPPINLPVDPNIIQLEIDLIKDEEIKQFFNWQKLVKQKTYQNQKLQRGKIEGSECKAIAIGNTKEGIFEGEIIQIEKKQKARLVSQTYIKHYENIKILDFNLDNDWRINEVLVTTYLAEQGKSKFLRFKKIKIYEGGFERGQEHGKGQMYDFENNRMYDGEWKEGRKEGKGKLQLLHPELYKNGDLFMYEGNFKNDEFEGYGIMYLNVEQTLSQEGNFKNGNLVGWQVVRSQDKVIANILYLQFFCCCKLRINIPNLISSLF